MTKLKELESRLKEIGCNFRFWGRAELRELANILLPGEVVEMCVNGRYEGGFAMLVATDQRVLLIDKKPLYLTLEDVRFDMISEIDYNHRMLDAAVSICTPNKSLYFLAYDRARLRGLYTFVQQRVMEVRQHYQQQSQVWQEYADSLKKQQEAAPAAPAPGQPLPDGSGVPAPQAGSALAVEPGQPRHPPAFPPLNPIVSTYLRQPVMSRQRQLLGSSAINSMLPPARG
ncbi:MAG TPA: PH domain-containing protein [Candidatus Saccharimonadales bacterium]